MTAGAKLPPHVVAVLGAAAARPVVARMLRRVRDESRGQPAGRVLLAVGPGAVAPEGVPLEPAGRALVGIIDGVRGVEIASARSSDAAEHMRAELSQRGAVGLYLDAGQRCAVMPVPLSASTTWDEVRGDARGYTAEHAAPTAAPDDEGAEDTGEQWRRECFSPEGFAAMREAMGPDAAAFFDALAELPPVDMNAPRPASERAEHVAMLSRALGFIYFDASTVEGWREAVRAAGADPERATLMTFDDGVSVAFYPKALR